jgi:hypothetical protein
MPLANFDFRWLFEKQNVAPNTMVGTQIYKQPFIVEWITCFVSNFYGTFPILNAAL